ncbi:helix-turn-helix transcriptional regulator [Victivallis sp. Marseille-Q1083]|uniref:helix-turn-helix domain-containing protein n=1 Tax=Victivallis sp. Marseille-Q1083 TaxID=2717288 RepID=UPI00158E0922|nr:helix-turn-helix transcriptional regulator [Victivallis sp. Marseille-Q1083]
MKLLEQHCQVNVVTSPESDDKAIDFEDTQFWKENKHRVLAGARFRAGLTQKALAERTGIRKSMLSEYENGKRKITRKTAEKLAEALNTYPEKFMDALG